MVRKAKPGELLGIKIVERLEKMFSRPESRLDAQKILGRLSADAQAYAKYLVVSGPTGNTATAKALGFKKEQFEAAVSELASALEISEE